MCACFTAPINGVYGAILQRKLAGLRLDEVPRVHRAFFG
jgi:hypothetical protein